MGLHIWMALFCNTNCASCFSVAVCLSVLGCASVAGPFAGRVRLEGGAKAGYCVDCMLVCFYLAVFVRDCANMAWLSCGGVLVHGLARVNCTVVCPLSAFFCDGLSICSSQASGACLFSWHGSLVVGLAGAAW